MVHDYNTAAEVRRAFWVGMGPGHPWRKRRGQSYAAECLSEFGDFVAMLYRNGHISESLFGSVRL